MCSVTKAPVQITVLWYHTLNYAGVAMTQIAFNFIDLIKNRFNLLV